MGEIKKSQSTIEAQREEMIDQSFNVFRVKSELKALSQLMVLTAETGDSFDLQGDDIAGLGLLLFDIASQLEEEKGLHKGKTGGDVMSKLKAAQEAIEASRQEAEPDSPEEIEGGPKHAFDYLDLIMQKKYKTFGHY